jgi:hypothetical protein
VIVNAAILDGVAAVGALIPHDSRELDAMTRATCGAVD